MKVVILAGGLGSRISEESYLKPKPMIKVGNHPILIHIMEYYSKFGFNDFIICLGYKSEVIKEYFLNYKLHNSDVVFDFKKNQTTFLKQGKLDWKVSLIETGDNTMTGGRLKRISHLIDEDNFMMTYGDGLSNINLEKLINFHKKSNVLATVTAVQPTGRFGTLEVERNTNVVKKFIEKPKGDNGWVNGGYFVLNKKVFNYIGDDTTVWEDEPLSNLASEGKLKAFKHEGFWHPMDTLRDKNFLNELWKKNNAPWNKI
jgi:glucose-1-phosphate cytidylyltransferase